MDWHRNLGTSFNSRDDYYNNMGYMANHMEETMVRTTWRPWKFTSVEEMSTPYQLKQQLYLDNMEEGHVRSFRTSGIACGPPLRGGLTCRV